jgi:hypothetical protein
MDIARSFSGNAAELAALAIERGRMYGLPVDPDKTNERLVRYYVAEGVLDRPDRIGRDAAYGYRHLLQLLTARRMAQAGMSLAVIAGHNQSALTRALEQGLDQPLPTQAELLVGSFMQRKPAPSRPASRTAPGLPNSPSTPPAMLPSMALPDVLDEVRRFKDSLSHSLDALRDEGRATRRSLAELDVRLQDLLRQVEASARHEVRAAPEECELLPALSPRLSVLAQDVEQLAAGQAQLQHAQARTEATLHEALSALQHALAQLECRVLDGLAAQREQQARDMAGLHARLQSLQPHAAPATPDAPAPKA